MDADKTVTANFSLIPPFELTSTAFNDEDPTIPPQYSYSTQVGGLNTSPPLAWTGVPTGTQSFVLIMDDREWGCVHWIIFNIPAGTTSLAAGASSSLPGDALHGISSNGLGYYGCDPDPGITASYHFTIYALNTMLALPEGATQAQVLAAMDGHIIRQAQMVGTYEG